MRSTTLLLRAAALAALFDLDSTGLAQGPLTPPGAPAPTGRTLDQISPRTPISTSTTITQPGSYYLTGNITVATGTAFTVSADNVTLDLNGFTISSTSAAPNGSAVSISLTAHQVTVMNGHIASNRTFSGGTFTGGGFSNGIIGKFSRNIRVANVSVAGVENGGIDLALGTGTVINGCTVRTAGTIGLRADSVSDSAALQIGGENAIDAGVVSNCIGTITTAGTPPVFVTQGRTSIPGGSGAFVISEPGSYVLQGNLTVTDGDGVRIDVDDVALDLNGFTISSTAVSPAAGNGVLINGVRSNISVRNGKIRGGTTLVGSTFTNAGFRNGLMVTDTIRNILVESLTVSNVTYGIYLSPPGPVAHGDSTVVRFCNINVASQRGILAAGVFESAATDCGDIAISAKSAANTLGESFTSTGLISDIALNCHGAATGSAPGMQVTTVTNCYGRNSGTGAGIQGSQVMNSSGLSNSGKAIDAYTATGCFGNSNTGIGIDATIGVSCRGISSSGTPLQITNRYLMP